MNHQSTDSRRSIVNVCTVLALELIRVHMRKITSIDVISPIQGITLREDQNSSNAIFMGLLLLRILR